MAILPDEWTTDAGIKDDITEDTVLTRARARNGAASSLRWERTTVPPSLGGCIAYIINREDIPQIRTRDDFLRDASNHRIRYWERRLADPDFTPQADVFFAHSMMEHVRAEIEASNSLVEYTEQTLRGAKTDFQQMMALDAAYRSADSVRDPEIEQTIRRMADRFSH